MVKCEGCQAELMDTKGYGRGRAAAHFSQRTPPQKKGEAPASRGPTNGNRLPVMPVMGGLWTSTIFFWNWWVNCQCFDHGIYPCWKPPSPSHQAVKYWRGGRVDKPNPVSWILKFKKIAQSSILMTFQPIRKLKGNQFIFDSAKQPRFYKKKPDNFNRK